MAEFHKENCLLYFHQKTPAVFNSTKGQSTHETGLFSRTKIELFRKMENFKESALYCHKNNIDNHPGILNNIFESHFINSQ